MRRPIPFWAALRPEFTGHRHSCAPTPRPCPQGQGVPEERWVRIGGTRGRVRAHDRPTDPRVRQRAGERGRRPPGCVHGWPANAGGVRRTYLGRLRLEDLGRLARVDGGPSRGTGTRRRPAATAFASAVAQQVVPSVPRPRQGGRDRPLGRLLPVIFVWIMLSAAAGSPDTAAALSVVFICLLACRVGYGGR